MTDEERDVLLSKLDERQDEMRVDIAVIKERVVNGCFVKAEDCAKTRLRMLVRILFLVVGPLVAGILGLVFALAQAGLFAGDKHDGADLRKQPVPGISRQP